MAGVRLELGSAELSILLSPFDLKRLESYANNMLDYHVVLDLLPTIASLFFEKRLGDEVRLSAVQSSILLAVGLQRKAIEEVEVSSHIYFRSLTALNQIHGIDGTPDSCVTSSCPLRQNDEKNQQAISGYPKGGHFGTIARSFIGGIVPCGCRRGHGHDKLEARGDHFGG